jgi:hypothetical protein
VITSVRSPEEDGDIRVFRHIHGVAGSTQYGLNGTSLTKPAWTTT